VITNLGSPLAGDFWQTHAGDKWKRGMGAFRAFTDTGARTPIIASKNAFHPRDRESMADEDNKAPQLPPI
jgi:hypothetical protein